MECRALAIANHTERLLWLGLGDGDACRLRPAERGVVTFEASRPFGGEPPRPLELTLDQDGDGAGVLTVGAINRKTVWLSGERVAGFGLPPWASLRPTVLTIRNHTDAPLALVGQHAGVLPPSASTDVELQALEGAHTLLELTVAPGRLDLDAGAAGGFDP